MKLPGGVRGAGWLAVAAVSLGLSPVLAGGAWAVEALLAAGVVVGTGALLARTRFAGGPGPRGAVVAVAGQVLALVVVVSFLFAPAQALLGLLPGPQAWHHLAQLAQQGRTAIAQESAPLRGDPGVRLLTTTGAGLLALAVDVLAVRLRRPAMAGLPLLGVHCTAVVFAPGGLSWGWFVLAALGYAVLLAADAEPRTAGWGRLVQRRPAAGGAPAAGFGGAGRTAAVIAVLAAVLVPSALPGTTDGFLLTGGGTGTGGGGAIDSVDPLIDLRSDLHTQGDAEVLSYRTDVKSPQPLRIVTVDTFDGQTWRPAPPDRSSLRAVAGRLPAPPGLAPATPRTTSRYAVQVGALRQQWLPVPYPAVGVSVQGDWQYDPATLNIAAGRGTRTSQGQRYTVDYLQVAPTSDQLASAQPVPGDLVAAYGTPPGDLPPAIARTAQDVTKDARGTYAKAVALQSFFRSGGGFTYSTDAPQPHSASALADFLTSRTGYCVHFASTMAVMARTLGIPARVAVGFLPGNQDSSGRWHISLRDAHAWPELYFAGAGWVRFEPTPASRTGAVPAWTVPAVTPSSPSAAAVPAPAAAAPTPVTQAQKDAATRGATSAGTTSGVSVPWQLPVVVALLAGLAAAPLVSRSVVRRRRWQRATGPGERAEAAWTDLVEQVGDLGIGVPVSATPRQVGERLGTSGQDAAVHRLVSAVERSRYAAPAPASAEEGLPGDVRTVVRSLVAARPRSATWRWRLLPPSGVAHLRGAHRRLLPPARRR